MKTGILAPKKAKFSLRGCCPVKNPTGGCAPWTPAFPHSFPLPPLQYWRAGLLPVHKLWHYTSSVGHKTLQNQLVFLCKKSLLLPLPSQQNRNGSIHALNKPLLGSQPFQCFPGKLFLRIPHEVSFKNNPDKKVTSIFLFSHYHMIFKLKTPSSLAPREIVMSSVCTLTSIWFIL